MVDSIAAAAYETQQKARARHRALMVAGEGRPDHTQMHARSEGLGGGHYRDVSPPGQSL